MKASIRSWRAAARAEGGGREWSICVITASSVGGGLTAGHVRPAAGAPGSCRAAQCGVAPLDQRRHQFAEAFEALADGEALLGPEVDPLEYRRDLEEGEAEVPGQRLEVEV